MFIREDGTVFGRTRSVAIAIPANGKSNTARFV